MGQTHLSWGLCPHRLLLGWQPRMLPQPMHSHGLPSLPLIRLEHWLQNRLIAAAEEVSLQVGQSLSQQKVLPSHGAVPVVTARQYPLPHAARTCITANAYQHIHLCNACVMQTCAIKWRRMDNQPHRSMLTVEFNSYRICS